MVKNRWWRQIHLSDTQILETTGSHITIQHGATNNYRSRYRSWPTVVSEKTQNFCVFWTKIVTPFYIKILDPPFKIVFTCQHLITVVQIAVNTSLFIVTIHMFTIITFIISLLSITLIKTCRTHLEKAIHWHLN